MKRKPTPAAPPDTGEATLGEVTVTGTRITRNGYSAPTPVTVVPTEDLLKTAPQGIPQGLETLPQFSASSGTQNTGNQATTPQGGNYLNLRGLGSIENLVLLNGQRLPPTSFNGTDRTVDNFVNRLRGKLEPDPNRKFNEHVTALSKALGMKPAEVAK